MQTYCWKNQPNTKGCKGEKRIEFDYNFWFQKQLYEQVSWAVQMTGRRVLAWRLSFGAAGTWEKGAQEKGRAVRW